MIPSPVSRSSVSQSPFFRSRSGPHPALVAQRRGDLELPAGHTRSAKEARSLAADGRRALRPRKDKLQPPQIPANLGRRYTNQALLRQAPERRYPILIAFLSEAYSEITDEIIGLFDHRLQEAESKARRELADFRQGAARATDEKVRLFRELGRILLDPEVPDAAVREAIYETVGSPEELLEAVEESEKLLRPADDNYYDFFAERYSYLRQFTPAFVEALDFRSKRKTTRCWKPSRSCAIETQKNAGGYRMRRRSASYPASGVPTL